MAKTMKKIHNIKKTKNKTMLYFFTAEKALEVDKSEGV